MKNRNFVQDVKEQRKIDYMTKEKVFTPEAHLEVYSLLVLSYAVQLIAERLIRSADQQGLIKTLAQEQRFNINNAVKEGNKMVHHLEAAFDETIERTCSGANNRYEVMRAKANELIQTFMLLTDRKDKDPEAGAKIRQFLWSLPGVGQIDLDKLFNYYKI